MKIYDSTGFSDEFGLNIGEKLKIIYEGTFNLGAAPDHYPDETHVKNIASRYPGEKICIDIEAWHFDFSAPYNQQAIIDQAMKYRDVLKWWKEVNPSSFVGFYGVMASSLFYTDATKMNYPDGFNRWRQLHDDIAFIFDNADFIMPSIYTQFKDVDRWIECTTTEIFEAQRIGKGKPVIPIFWYMGEKEDYPADGQELSPSDIRRMMVYLTNSKMIDAVAIWARGRERPVNPKHLPWFKELKKYL